MEIVSENTCLGGIQGVYSHLSSACQCDMTFGLFLPERAKQTSVPLLWYLSGLTCTHENAMTKAGAQIWAAREGIAVAFPDTSPRGDDVPDHEDYDLGKGAGFYVNAAEAPWSRNFRMWDYISDELPSLVVENFPIIEGAQGITGHSMGGHGALTLAMSKPGQFKSVSAFAPIVRPSASDWGRKQFESYLGSDRRKWMAHDATELLLERRYPGHILIDQGESDQFLDLLRPRDFAEAIESTGQSASLRIRKGYDHSYFFVMSFMEAHVAHHSRILGKLAGVYPG